jgi:hypothetical protein
MNFLLLLISPSYLKYLTVGSASTFVFSHRTMNKT